MKYKDDDIEKLNQSLKIEEVVGQYVELKRAGSNFKGLCPFHSDTTPSFMVSPSKNICKCFVCGAGGNPLKFYSSYKKISFNQAVKELSDTYQIPVRENYATKEITEEYKEYYEIMRLANEFYGEKIFENPGRESLDYLTRRGITPENIKKSKLGYALNSKSTLTDYLLEKGYGLSELVTLGLSKENENGVYDNFRNRIIFPIYSLENKVIAFGARSLENNKNIPKYINSPDTPIFKKGNILYGIGDKNSIIRKKKYSILMEGYMDVLMSTLHGFDVTLAPLGTALTEEQGKLLKRFTNNVILSFDMDAPGQKATEKAILTLKKLGFSIRVVEVEGAKDPDEYIKKFGKESFLKQVKNSIESFDFLYKFYAKDYDLEDIFAKQNFIKGFKEFFSSVEDKIEQSLYIDKLAMNIGVSKEILWETLVVENKTNKKVKRMQEDTRKKIEDKEKEYEIENLTASLILMNNNYYKYFKNKDFQSEFLKKIMLYFEKKIEYEEEMITINTLIKSEEFSESEQEKLLDFSLIKYTRYSGKEEQEKLFITIMSDWLRNDVLEFQKKRINIEISLELKRIDAQLKLVANIEEVLLLCSRFNKILENRFFDI
ncbi:MAG: DNA primase [Fusobacteriaceae bacterium]